MIIVKSEKKTRAHDLPLGKKAGVLLVAFFVLAVTISIYLVTNMEQVRGYIFQKGFNAINVESISSVIKRIPVDYISSFMYKNPEKIRIDIKFKYFQKLQEKRNKSFREGFIVQGVDDFVPAIINYKNKDIRVKLRIKGDNLDHLLGDKWSFRVEVKGEKALFGMRRFSIQNPIARGFQGQYLIDLMRHKYGLIALRRKVVEVVVNGNSVGIMEIEEHFSKELLESNGRKESVIIKFDETDFWKWGELFDFSNTRIDSFRDKYTSESKILSSHREISIGLLRGFLQNKLKASEVFDPREMGMFLAINQLWGAQHGVRWGNMRFYYNPYIGLLQPIGYDDNFHERLGYREVIDTKLFNILLADNSIHKSYVSSLSTLVSDVLEGDLIGYFKKHEDPHYKSLVGEFFLLEKYKYDDLVKRAKHLSSYLDALNVRGNSTTNVNRKIPEMRQVHAYLVQENNGFNLEVASAIPFNVTIASISHSNPSADKKLKKEFSTIFPMTLLPRHNSENLKFEIIENISEDLLINAKLEVETNDGEFKKYPISRYYPVLKKSVISSNNLDDLFHRGVVEVRKNILVINSGEWKISKSYLIEGYDKFIIEDGVKLKFEGDSGLISRVPVEIRGANKGVKFIGEDGKGGWFYIINDTFKSSIENLQMSNVGPVEYGNVQLTGSLVIYKGEINIVDLVINDNSSEDALNIISAKYNVRNCKVYNTASDAIDIDYAIGEINGCTFSSIGLLGGGDAVDYSGSTSKLFNSNFTNISDKAISVGEASKVEIQGVQINKASVGLASKDGSKVNISDSSIEQSSHAPIMAYVKKNEYSMPIIEAVNVKIDDPESIISAENSLITVDGVVIEKTGVDAKELYQTIMKSGMKK